MILTVSTCGTSMFTNGVSGEDRKFLYDNANKLENEYNEDEIARLKSIVERRREFILQERDENNIREKSAELNGLIGYYRKNKLTTDKSDIHWLIHTDTYQGQLAAEYIRDWGISNGFNMNMYKVDDLNTRDLESFRAGIDNLVNWCEDTIPGYRNGYKVIFNLVGGFKILQGYMQTLGMFYADESVYIFEGSNEILSIPRLPVDFTADTLKMINDNINLIRALQWRSMKVSECSRIPDTMLSTVGGDCGLSTWGKLMFNKTRDEIYSKKLLPPPTLLIQYSEKVEQTASKLEKFKLIEVNKKIDDLARYLEGGKKQSINSLDLKTLKNNPKPPSTHEFDLWADKDAWRGYGYFDNSGKTFIINEIGEPLHKG